MEKHQVAEHQAVIHPDDTPQYSRESLRSLAPYDTFELNGDIVPAADVLDENGSLRESYLDMYEQAYEPSHPETPAEPIDLERARILKDIDLWDKLYDRYSDTARSDQEARDRTEAKLGTRPELPVLVIERSPYVQQAIDTANEHRIAAATTASDKVLMRAQAVGRASLYGRRS